jgi:hypothetical protein
LRLTTTRYETSHGVPGYTFLSLGCKVNQTETALDLWCFSDDTVYEHEMEAILNDYTAELCEK